ncbi:MAG: methyltransferase family protein [Candidatus Polarisedimenticolia bacterium]
MAFVYVFAGALVLLSRPRLPEVLAGAALVVIGESIRLWAAGHLVKSVRLVTSGPYAYTQNPLYLGRLAILTGLAVAARVPGGWNLVALGIGWAVFFIYYLPRKLRVEGDRLRRLHGPAFDAYHGTVPILFPAPRRYPQADRDPWSFRQMVRNQEPFVAALLAAAIALLAFRTR